MRIDGVSLRFVRIPFKRAFSHALKQRTEAETVLVTVRSANGTTGIGEIVPRSYLTGETLESVLESIAPARARRCLGKVLSSEAEVVSFLRQELDGAGRELATLGGFELAVLDLAGKELGFQAASVLGPPVSSELPPGVFIGFEVRTPELKKHCALLRLSGKRYVKVKVGQPDDVERLEIVSAALGGIALRLDANGAWTSHEAIERLKLFASRFRIESVEQPVPSENWEDMRRVRAETGVAVMADESLCTLDDGRRLIEAGAADIFNVRVGKCGGFLGSLRLVELARSTGLGLHLGALVGETAVLSRAAELFGRRVEGFACLEGKHQNRFLLSGDVATEADGVDGLGLEIREDWIRNYEVKRQDFGAAG